VLLDLKLPDGTGLDVLRELQRRSPVTPVVVISGYGRVEDAVEAMRLGAAEYLEKPVARERLYEVLDKTLAPMPARDGGAREGWHGRSALRHGRPLGRDPARISAGRHGGADARARADLGRARQRQGAGRAARSTRCRRGATSPSSR
jgi:hypothetical protein